MDLDGSTGQAGTLETVTSFAPGKYTLTFDLGGNARGDVAKTTMITLGDFSASLPLISASPLTPYTFSFTTSGGHLSFKDNAVGNQNIGNILDNVMLTMATAIPEPATWARLAIGLAGLGYASSRSSRKGARLEI